MGLTRKQKMMLVVLVFGSFITILNQTLVTPALPAIIAETGVDAATAQWLITGFTLVNAIMIPVTAYLQDRFSTRKLFLVSMAMFTVGSALAGYGHNFETLLAGRLVQAAGAGILMPMTMTVLMIMFPVEKRGSAMGLFGLVISFAPAIGPTVAGFIVDQANWHIMFFGITVLSVFVIVSALFLMEDRAGANKGDAVLDPLSVVLSTLGFGCLLYGFSIFGSYGASIASIATMIVGVVGMVWFFVRQTRLPEPMLRVQVLKNRKFLIGTIIGMLVQGGLLAAGVLMPIYIQTLMGYPATMSGLVLMPGAIIMGIMNPVAGKLFDKHGPRKLGIIGMALLTVTTLAFVFIDLNTSLIYLTAIYTVRMLSMTLVNMPITTWGMNALDIKVMNHGTSVNNTLRQVAGSLGTAIIISASTMTESFTAASLGDAQATMLGINVAFLVCTILMIIGLVLTIAFVKEKPGVAEADDAGDERKSLLRSIMKTDVYTLPVTATVQDAMVLFIEKGISAAPIVNEQGEPVGFISDGDILKRLSHQTGSFVDPIVLIANSVRDDTAYDEKLEQLMSKRVSDVGVNRSIGVNIHADLAEVCRVLSQNHLKKVPVMEAGHIVGIINRSDITQYSMKAYLEGRPDLAA